MKEDLIQFPVLAEIKEMLTQAKADVAEELQHNEDAASAASLLTQVIGILEQKIAGKKDLAALNDKEKIDLAAHLSFFDMLLADIFDTCDEDFDEDFEGEEDLLDDGDCDDCECHDHDEDLIERK